MTTADQETTHKNRYALFLEAEKELREARDNYTRKMQAVDEALKAFIDNYDSDHTIGRALPPKPCGTVSN